MTKKQIAILNSDYRLACVNYVCAFAKKQGLEFDYFMNEMTCDIAVMSDYYFELPDIIYDIQTSQPKGLILKWQNDGIEYLMKHGFGSINYQSYCAGLRYEDLG